MQNSKASAEVQRVVILGGGSAGFLAALTFRLQLPQLHVHVVHSPDIPVIGVGESTTRAVPIFLHDMLGLDRAEFFREVQPSWKLGLRLEWGDPAQTHFNYPFDYCIGEKVKGLEKLAAFYCLDDMTDFSLFGALMDHGRSPCIIQNGQIKADNRTAYHIKNESFIDYLRLKSKQQGAELIEGSVVDVDRDESGDVTALKLSDGRVVEGDLFIDCSGFRSVLLDKTMGERYVNYGDTLFCDRAVIGSWVRDDEILPFTTAETMNHGWCWRIEFRDVVTRGYVYSSKFCSDDEAMREMKEKNPALGDDLSVIKFRCGRYENFWVNNVAAVGNASGFVEPLEATALHLIIEQIRFVVQSLCDSDCRVAPAMREVENERFRRIWDDTRDFLAVHYRFNRMLDTPFWQHCREHTDLGGAQRLVDYYRDAGPSGLNNIVMEPRSIFGYVGYITMLVGQRVATNVRRQLTDRERKAWEAYRNVVKHNVTLAVPMREALEHFYTS
ncbi:MAG: tryptophan halogenase family protein [Pirellulales bacterium]